MWKFNTNNTWNTLYLIIKYKYKITCEINVVLVVTCCKPWSKFCLIVFRVSIGNDIQRFDISL